MQHWIRSFRFVASSCAPSVAEWTGGGLYSFVLQFSRALIHEHTDGYTGNVYLLVKMLLPTAGKKRVYNLQSKQIVKHLSQVSIYSRFAECRCHRLNPYSDFWVQFGWYGRRSWTGKQNLKTYYTFTVFLVGGVLLSWYLYISFVGRCSWDC